MDVHGQQRLNIAHAFSRMDTKGNSNTGGLAHAIAGLPRPSRLALGIIVNLPRYVAEPPVRPKVSSIGWTTHSLA